LSAATLLTRRTIKRHIMRLLRFNAILFEAVSRGRVLSAGSVAADR
jgi:hypothetical protein